MEVQLRDIESSSLEKKNVIDIIDQLSDVMKDATELRDIELVEDPKLTNALHIVESFIRRKQRICYGGMAINAHLPTHLKFYNFNKVLPDYDFFTPEPEKDTKELVGLFRKAGYTEIADRIGIHAGTTKLFINYIGVADISGIPEWMYSILKKRAIEEKGILYTDADFLRMNMYLELSRPRGEVERWDKVYKRLVLLNLAKNPHKQSCSYKRKRLAYKVPKPIHTMLLEYIVNNGLIFAGSELKRIYSNPKSNKVGYILNSQSPVLAYSESPEHHIHMVRQILFDQTGIKNIKLLKWPSFLEEFPAMWGIQIDGSIAFICIEEKFCNSYNIVKLPNNTSLRIVSLDSAITLFYMLTFIKGLEGIVPGSIHCFADSLVEISMRTRDKGKSGVYPLFIKDCHGHQHSKASLLREKSRRIYSLKQKQFGIRKTVKRRKVE
jgi:hypothetical protein